MLSLGRDSSQIARLAWGLLLLALACGGGETAQPTSLKVNLEPGHLQNDPGPELVIGAENGTQGGKPFYWVDLTLEGEAQSYRVYFDRLDGENYHYLDRQGSALTLGLTESGIEQVLTKVGLDPAESGSVRLARHGARMGLFQGGRLLGRAFDDRRQGGVAGVRRLSGASLPALKAEARDEFHFADDFMREENKASAWRKFLGSPERGDFALKSLRNPLLSANAFNYMGVGANILSVTGQPWWDHYRYEAALRGPARARLGVVFAFQDERNYGLFRWTARPLNADGSTSGAGLQEVVRVRNGEEQVLHSAPGGYLPDQWYQVRVESNYAAARITVDGHLVAEVHDPYLAAGCVGLWCDVAKPADLALEPKALPFAVNSLNALMQQHAVFDDVKVSGLEGFEDAFRAAGPLAEGWLTGTGEWTVAVPVAGQAGELQVRTNGESSRSLIGNRRWAQYQVSCEADPGQGLAGLVFLYRDEHHYFTARTDGKELVLAKVDDGQETIVDRAPFKTPAAEGFLPLTASVKDGHLLVTGLGGTTVEGFEGEGVVRGRAGLYMAPGPGNGAARFRRFALTFLDEAEPLVTTNAIFEDETSMEVWTKASKEWDDKQDDKIVDGQRVTLHWHWSLFPGNVELVVEPRETRDERFEVALSVAKDGKGANNGYVFRYQAGQPGEKGVKRTLLKIQRQGETVSEKALAEDVRELATLSLRRAGKYVIGKVNGRSALYYRDDQPLSGAKVAYYAKGLEMRTESTKIISEHFHNETFSRAPVDWRTAGYAIAEVANRWQCDPRWTFYSLKNDRARGKPAVLWSKKLYPGDLTVEFYVGNKMEGERGRPYTYARDINVTLCGDGHDLTKGYTFMWGGQENRFSMIYRNDEQVKQMPRTIPMTMEYHRHWFFVRIEKRGNRLTYRVDQIFAPSDPPNGTPMMVYEDPNPLTGDRVALWTYDHAIMISRVRISGEGGTSYEDPWKVFESVDTIYEHQPKEP